MIDSERYRLSNRIKYISWLILLAYIIFHVLQYVPEYSLPHWDYFNVMHVLHYLHSPELFVGDRISATMSSIYTTTAPIYFYGLAYPLNFLFSAKWALLSIGFILTILTVYFAGGTWNRWTDLLVVTLVLVVLLHGSLNPLEGNRRSFTALFLLAMFWLENHSSYLAELFLTGLAAGIYPPVALMMLAYFAIKELHRLYRGSTDLSASIYRLAGLTLIFLIVLMPYWMDVLSPGASSSASMIAQPFTYNFSSISESIQTVLIGSKEHRGALFRDQIQFDLFLGFLCLITIQKLLLGKRFEFKKRYVYLVVASVALWTLSHVLYPLIYHPFKYTRLSLLLVVVMSFGENIPRTVNALRQQIKQSRFITLILLFLSIWFLGIWSLYVQFPANFSFLLIDGILGRDWWKFVFAMPVVLSVPMLIPRSAERIRSTSLSVVVVLCLMVFLPNGINHYSRAGTKSLRAFDGMYKFLRNSPPGTTVAAPPKPHANPIPAFAKRPVFASASKSMFDFVCERYKRFWNIYFHPSAFRITEFLQHNDIDYLLVDRKLIRMKIIYGNQRCLGNVDIRSDSYLNRHFPEADWSKNNRLYLVGEKAIRSESTPF